MLGGHCQGWCHFRLLAGAVLLLRGLGSEDVECRVMMIVI